MKNEFNVLPELDDNCKLSKINELYNFSCCTIEEYNDLIEFLDNVWKKNHIFVHSRKLLDWQHLDKINIKYNFILAREKKSNKIHSILGFVPISHFDKSIENSMVSICIWKTVENFAVKGLGIGTYNFLKKNYNVHTFCSLAVSQIAFDIYKHWNFDIGYMNQFYIINKKYKKFSLIDNFDGRYNNNCPKSNDIYIKELSKNEFDEIDEIFFHRNYLPIKTKLFYINRFFNHPIYQYQCYCVKNNENKLIAIFFSRICYANASKAMRIVDFIGEIKECLGLIEQLQKLLINNDIEYVDLINVGYKIEDIEKLGFIYRTDTSDVIVPHLFEPFVRENINIRFAFKTVDKDAKYLIFKSDADLDRPNLLFESDI